MACSKHLFDCAAVKVPRRSHVMLTEHDETTVLAVCLVEDGCSRVPALDNNPDSLTGPFGHRSN
jgi:hypothetical protein